MLLPAVEYARPSTVEQAIELLAGNSGARPLAGGQTLINVMKARASAPDLLVDLNGLGELRGVRAGGDGGLEIGAMTTYSDLLRSTEIGEGCPVIAEVAASIADVQVRNRGTIGGNVCLSDPTNHFPPLMVALGAEMALRGPDGERTVAADEFFLGVYFTAVGPGELLTAITVPAGAGGAFAAVTLGRDGTCIASAAAALNGGAPRVALGCVDAVPVLVRPASSDDSAVRDAVRSASFDPPADVHASAEYRRHLAEVCAARAVSQASERAR